MGSCKYCLNIVSTALLMLGCVLPQIASGQDSDSKSVF